MLLHRLGFTPQVIKTALAAGLAWSLATRISPNTFPYFAPLAVIVTFQATLADTTAQAIYRVSGIMLGVIVSMLVGYWLHLGAVAISLATLLGMAIPTALHLNRTVVSQVGVTALMVLAVHDPGHYALYRVLESALGAAIGILVNAVIVPNDIPLAERRIFDLAGSLSESLSNLSSKLGESQKVPVSHLVEKLERGTSNAYQALRSAETSGRLNPFLRGRAVRLERLAEALRRLEKVAVEVWAVATSVDEFGARDEGQGADLRAALTDTAECIGAFGRAVKDDSPANLTLLEQAVARARATQSHCFPRLREQGAIGTFGGLAAILTGLKRILDHLTL